MYAFRAMSFAGAAVALAWSMAAVAGFSPTGDMSLGQGGRYGAFAAALPDGRVLFAGGYNGVSLSSAELYDPQTGTFSAGSNDLSVARGFGRTITLADGRVLIIGGGAYDETGAVANVDLYDPSNGLFTATGSLHDARVAPMAALLANGKVLVAGGIGADGSTRLTSAEIYDPTTGTFTPTGSMLTARDNGVVALLQNGKVLIAGGGNGTGQSYSAAELYDPVSGTFSATGNMNVARDDATATALPNGKVLVAGGANQAAPNGSAELYDPAAGTFTPSAASFPARDYASAVLLPNHLVLIVGGQGDTHGLGDTGALADAVLYDPALDTFSAAGTMTTARFYAPAMPLPDGRVLLAGGYDNNGVVSAAELYSFSVVDEIFANSFE